MAAKKKTEAEQQAEERVEETVVTEAAEEPAAEAAEAAEEPVAEAAPAEVEAEEKPKKARKTTKKKSDPEPEAEATAAPDTDASATSEEEADGQKKKKRRDNYLREKKMAIPKGLSEEEAIEYMTSRDTFSGAMASKERRKELRSGERVITRTGYEKVVTLETIRDEEYKELRGAAQAGRILEGEIIGVRQTDPDNPTSPILADVRYKTGSFKVSIPSNLLFNYNEDQYQGVEGSKDLFNAVKQRITSTVDFVPAYVDESQGICYADRLRAISMIGVKKYLTPMKGDDMPEIVKGCLVQGRVVAVGRTYVIVDAIGVDIRVPQDELSYLHIGDARNSFSVDTDVNIKILQVGEDTVTHGKNKYRLVKAKGSIKQAYPDMRKKYIDQYNVGTFASAVITYIDDNMHVFCELNGGQIDCLCGYPKAGNVPVVGQKRMVKIELKDEEHLRLFGRFVSN